MIANSKAVSNAFVNVVFTDNPFPVIGICNPGSGRFVQTFSGIDDLEEMFNEYQANVNENVTIDDAISFFKVNQI